MLNDQISKVPDMELLREIGKKLNACRLKNHWTQAKLATESGVSKRTIERLEAGESVQLTNWIRILRALDLLSSIDVLLSDAALGERNHNKKRSLLLSQEQMQRLKAAKSVSDAWPYKGEKVEGLECYSRYRYPKNNS